MYCIVLINKRNAFKLFNIDYSYLIIKEKNNIPTLNE